MSSPPVAEDFTAALLARAAVPGGKEGRARSLKAREPESTQPDQYLGVRMRQVFDLAKQFVEMSPREIERLLEIPIHEVRVGALSIMGKQFQRKQTTDARRTELYELYMRRTDRINNWDLVDVSAHQVVGGYLFDKPRDKLYELAHSDRWWERRIAIWSTMYFVRHGDLDDTFQIASLLLDDDHDLIQKVTGGMLREAGKKDEMRLLHFLDKHAPTMARDSLRYAIEHLDRDARKHYLSLRTQ